MVIAGEQAAVAIELLELAAILLATRLLELDLTLLDSDEALSDERLAKLEDVIEEILNFELLELKTELNDEPKEELKDELDLLLETTEELVNTLLTELEKNELEEITDFELLELAATELAGTELAITTAELLLLRLALDEPGWLVTADDTIDDCPAELEATESKLLAAELAASDTVDELARLLVTAELVAAGVSLPAVPPPPPQAASRMVEANNKPNFKHFNHACISFLSRAAGSGPTTNSIFTSLEASDCYSNPGSSSAS